MGRGEGCRKLIVELCYVGETSLSNARISKLSIKGSKFSLFPFSENSSSYQIGIRAVTMEKKNAETSVMTREGKLHGDLVAVEENFFP